MRGTRLCVYRLRTFFHSCGSADCAGLCIDTRALTSVLCSVHVLYGSPLSSALLSRPARAGYWLIACCGIRWATPLLSWVSSVSSKFRQLTKPDGTRNLPSSRHVHAAAGKPRQASPGSRLRPCLSVAVAASLLRARLAPYGARNFGEGQPVPVVIRKGRNDRVDTPP